MIKIALTNLRRYNEGELVFEWVDLPCEDFTDALNAIGNPEEYFISDYECEIPHIVVHEYDNLERLNELAEELENLKNFEKIILQAIIEVDDVTVYEALEVLRDDAYIFYDTDDFDEFIDMQIEDGFFGEIPEKAKEFLDRGKLIRHFEHNGYMLTSVGVIFTF